MATLPIFALTVGYFIIGVIDRTPADVMGVEFKFLKVLLLRMGLEKYLRETI